AAPSPSPETRQGHAVFPPSQPLRVRKPDELESLKANKALFPSSRGEAFAVAGLICSGTCFALTFQPFDSGLSPQTRLVVPALAVSHVSAGLVKIRRAFHQFCFRAVVHRVHHPPLLLITVAPERRRAMLAVNIQRIEIQMEGSELLLVVVVIPCHAVQRFEAGIRRR